MKPYGRDVSSCVEAGSLVARVVGVVLLVHGGASGAAAPGVDPRTGLQAGYEDAGQAASGLQLTVHLPLPPGFVDPINPTGFIMPPSAPMPGKDSKDSKDIPKQPSPSVEHAETNGKTKSPAFAFANTDIVFSGEHLIQGNFHGFNTYDIALVDQPRLIASTVCPGGQADLTVYKNLLFLSVEQTFARVDCGTQGVPEPVSKERFRGVRIFDISDVNNPRQVAAVQTCRGSHTNTLIPDPNDPNIIYLYNSATSSIRSAEELAGCSDKRDDPNTSLFRIDVIKVALNAPEKAAIVAQPRIFADPKTGVAAGLWKGGDYGPGTQASYETDTCHDITAFPQIGLAAGACQGNGILLDISDPARPVRVDEVADTNFSFWHSATFSNDGSKVLFTDEWGGGTRPRCLAKDPKNWGGDAIFDIVERKLRFRSYYKMPAVQGELETCVAHNGGLIPVPGRDILVQAWFQGGISVMDFTDSAHPFEIGYFDRGALDSTRLRLGGEWSAYWYGNRIYASESARGLDLLKLLPSQYLSKNEIAAAGLARQEPASAQGGALNPQTQPRMSWPADPVVARAYLDQLQRSNALAPARASDIDLVLKKVEKGRGAQLAQRLKSLAAALENDIRTADAGSSARLRLLAGVLREEAAAY